VLAVGAPRRHRQEKGVLSSAKTRAEEATAWRHPQDGITLGRTEPQNNGTRRGGRIANDRGAHGARTLTHRRDRRNTARPAHAGSQGGQRNLIRRWPGVHPRVPPSRKTRRQSPAGRESRRGGRQWHTIVVVMNCCFCCGGLGSGVCGSRRCNSASWCRDTWQRVPARHSRERRSRQAAAPSSIRGRAVRPGGPTADHTSQTHLRKSVEEDSR